MTTLPPGRTSEAQALEARLLSRQNPDGSWGFENQTSWTEPTALALLALSVGTDHTGAGRRAIPWLARTQQPDGGWSAQPGVRLSTWLTGLVSLALLQHPWQVHDRQRALAWVQNQIQPKESFFTRIASRFGGSSQVPVNHYGASWFPGTAAWLYPTAITVLFYLQMEQLTGDTTLGTLGRKGQEYILSRRCKDGGWNHGGAPFMDEEAFSYPEMTGLALLALGGVPVQELRLSIACAQKSMLDPASGEGLSWLMMGLAAQGLAVQAPLRTFPYRNARDIALRLLALSAKESRNLLVSRHCSVLAW